MIPQEQNDRLLELDGGCRHEWVMADFVYLCCQKCRAYYPKTDNNYPTVGDGHQMTLGEMVRLGLTKVNCEIIFRADGVSLYDLDEDEEFWQPVKTLDELPAALAAAIIAAVDGAK